MQLETEITKRILFSGDSITKGELGCSYMQPLARQFPQYKFINLGQDGDTLLGIMNRTLEHLKQDSAFDLIVIAAGHNDILLPDFMQKTVIHRSIVNSLNAKGSIPAADFDDFISIFEEFIKSIQNIVSIPIVVTTLSCLNENLSAPTNVKRFAYNQGLREFAAAKNLGLADVATQFNDILHGLDCRDFFMDDLFGTVLFDHRKSKTAAGADKLSQKRSLHLTIDGIHLNSHGAEIYCEVFESLLLDTLK